MTLEQAQAHYADSLAALTAARLAVSLGDGSQQVTRASIMDLQGQVDRWAIEVSRLEAIAAGVPPASAGYLVASWG
jgi:hypothetical protein